MSICDELRSGAGTAWTGLHGHPFVRGMADGTLPPERFRFYVEQNLLYLPHFARVLALGAARSDDLGQMATFAAACTEVLEIEIPTNRDLLARVAELAPEPGGITVQAPANLGYTSYLVQLAYAGGPAEIMAAIMPCAWSYGEIAREIGDVAPHPVYEGWIGFFASAEYWAVVEDLQDQFARMADGADRDRLQEIFTTSVRLERGFWDMAWECAVWADMAGAAA